MLYKQSRESDCVLSHLAYLQAHRPHMQVVIAEIAQKPGAQPDVEKIRGSLVSPPLASAHSHGKACPRLKACCEAQEVVMSICQLHVY